MEIGFQERQLAIGVARVDTLNHAFAPCVPIIRRNAERPINLVIGAEVPHICEALMSAAGTSCETERLWLERAAAQIPEIVRTG